MKSLSHQLNLYQTAYIQYYSQLYASPQKSHTSKAIVPRSREYIPDVEEIYADVVPPPLPAFSVNLAEDLEDSGIQLPPPPPRTSYGLC